ncbi:MAG TPA: SGNH/GDSL hydrolase family protein [Verrucomicrobiae bacterium]|nr:SGNH/GDSL hydrolase family protein [Verrucomicrobiae bacterium]
MTGATAPTLLRRAVAWGLAILLSFACAEVALRIFQRIHPTFLLSESSYNRFRGRPGDVVFGMPLNSGGFKDVEHPRDKPAGTYRIVALGDSFAFGSVPYEDNYLTLLGQRLSTETRIVEVINMGVSGAGPQDYLALLLDEGLAYRPDLVLVSFFVGNDFTDTKRVNQSSRPRSAVATLVRSVHGLLFRNAGLLPATDHYDDTAKSWTDDTYLAMERDRTRIYEPGGTGRRIYLDAIEFLARIQSVCADHDIGLAVVIIPDELQVRPDLRRRVMGAPGDTTKGLDFGLPNRFLEEQLTTRRIDHCDLLDRFAGASEREVLYKPNDSHWNLAGNRLAADVLAGFLAPGLQGAPK